MHIEELIELNKELRILLKAAIGAASKNDPFWPNATYWDRYEITKKGITFQVDYNDMGHERTQEYFLSAADFAALNLSI